MKILNFGSLNIDNVYRVPHFVRKGETLSSDSLAIFCGGKGLNQSVALGRAGAAVYHAGSVGQDGGPLLELLAGAGVSTAHVAVLRDVRTGNAIIQNDAEGDNCILLYGGANRCITRAQVDAALADFSAGDFLVLQNEINELAYIVRRAHEKGMILVLNPSPMDDKLREVELGLIDWFILNEIEAAQLTGSTGGTGSTGDVVSTGDAVSAGDALLEELLPPLRAAFPNAKIVLTLGARGSCYADAQRVVTQPIFPVNVVDTTAAGDTFTGYFLAATLRGQTVEEALEQAARASSIAVSRAGAAPSIPTLNEVLGTPAQA